MARSPIPGLVRRYYAMEDKLFDLLHGLNTGGVILGPDLHPNSQFAAHGNPYQAAWCSTIRTLMNLSFKKGIRPSVFIDIGCGKGKVCFYAATTKKFKKIIGVEYERSLVDHAEEFRQRFLKYPIEFLHKDATEFSLPDSEQCMVFMFNPFDATVMRLFLKNNLPSFRSQKHVVAYANDMQHEVLRELGFTELYRDSVRKMSLWQYQEENQVK